MPYIPHTQDDIQAMLQTIGVDSIASLFADIPAELRSQLQEVPPRISEMQVNRLMHERAQQDSGVLCFAGAGAYDHHIPAAVWELTTRGEYYSAYTPYQAEASQGTLQLLYEYQSMMASLNAMEVSNASLYDGASALAEAVLMAIRANRKAKSRTVLVPAALHPHYRHVVETIVRNQDITLQTIPFDPDTGLTKVDNIPPGEYAAMIIAQPNFFGCLEGVDALSDTAHAAHMTCIALVNPLLLSVLKPPGQWGEKGVDIACGEGQPLGIPMASGGPYFGFMCCRQALVRQLPGRLVGRTVDSEGKTGFTLTLQAREQHIRRSKATSNICTNQGLLVTAATLYMSMMGAHGMAQAAWMSHHHCDKLVHELCSIDGVEKVFSASGFHEVAVRLPQPVPQVLGKLTEHRILGGYDLSADFPDLGHAMLVCATETKTDQDIERYAHALHAVLST